MSSGWTLDETIAHLQELRAKYPGDLPVDMCIENMDMSQCEAPLGGSAVSIRHVKEVDMGPTRVILLSKDFT
jgi:hypothetical protein